MPLPKSYVWQYFTRDGDKARCKVGNCGALFSLKATSSLTYHLQTAHKISKPSGSDDKDNSTSSSGASSSASAALSPSQAAQNQNQQSGNASKKQKTILDCFSFQSLEETVARLAAKDGLTIRQITRSQYIRACLAKDFPNRTIPKNEGDMIALIEIFYEREKDQVKRKLSSLKEKGVKFSATLDEWTSLQNLRYINVNLHYSVGYSEAKYVNLGMIKIDISCPADLMITLVSRGQENGLLLFLIISLF